MNQLVRDLVIFESGMIVAQYAVYKYAKKWSG